MNQPLVVMTGLLGFQSNRPQATNSPWLKMLPGEICHGLNKKIFILKMEDETIIASKNIQNSSSFEASPNTDEWQRTPLSNLHPIWLSENNHDWTWLYCYASVNNPLIEKYWANCYILNLEASLIWDDSPILAITSSELLGRSQVNPSICQVLLTMLLFFGVEWRNQGLNTSHV